MSRLPALLAISCVQARAPWTLHTMPKIPPDITQAVIAAAHARHLRVLAHVFYLGDANRLMAQGSNGFVPSVRDQSLDAALLDAMRAHGTWQVAATLSREVAVHAFGAPNPITHVAAVRR